LISGSNGAKKGNERRQPVSGKKGTCAKKVKNGKTAGYRQIA